MNEENSTKPKAPYLPYSTFMKFIGGFQSGVPSRIDKSLMNGHSGSMQSWLLGALRFFSLIDESGAPAEELEQLATADDDERRKVWQNVFTKAYAPIIDGLDLKRATLGQLYESFGAEFSVETKKKCQSFFSGGAEDAGIELAPQLKPNARGTGPRKPRKARSTSAKSGESDQQDGFEHGAHQKHATAILLLDASGERLVRLSAPPKISQAELDRIQKWLSYQLIVEDATK